MLCEAVFADLQERRGAIAAGVMNGDSERCEGFGCGDKTFRVVGPCGIACNCFSSGAHCFQLLQNNIEPFVISSGDDDRKTALCEAPRGCGTQSARCADAHNQHATLLRHDETLSGMLLPI